MKLFVAARVVGRVVRVVVVNASVVEMAMAAIAEALQMLFILLRLFVCFVAAMRWTMAVSD